MDTLLLGITVISLAVALVMSVTTWRLMREEKRRTAGRMAALSAQDGFEATSRALYQPLADWLAQAVNVQAIGGDEEGEE